MNYAPKYRFRGNTVSVGTFRSTVDIVWHDEHLAVPSSDRCIRAHLVAASGKSCRDAYIKTFCRCRPPLGKASAMEQNESYNTLNVSIYITKYIIKYREGRLNWLQIYLESTMPRDAVIHANEFFHVVNLFILKYGESRPGRAM